MKKEVFQIKRTPDKIKACILGHAVGDALGVPVEFSSREILEAAPVIEKCGFCTCSVPASALYGVEAIPDEWLGQLIKIEYIENMCDTVAENC